MSEATGVYVSLLLEPSVAKYFQTVLHVLKVESVEPSAMHVTVLQSNYPLHVDHSIAIRVEPDDLTLEYLSRDVLALTFKSKALSEFRNSLLERELRYAAKNNLPIPKRLPFNPHLTLAYSNVLSPKVLAPVLSKIKTTLRLTRINVRPFYTRISKETTDVDANYNRRRLGDKPR